MNTSIYEEVNYVPAAQAAARKYMAARKPSDSDFAAETAAAIADGFPANAPALNGSARAGYFIAFMDEVCRIADMEE